MACVTVIHFTNAWRSTYHCCYRQICTCNAIPLEFFTRVRFNVCVVCACECIYFKRFSRLIPGREQVRGWARARFYRIIATTLPGCLLLLLFCCCSMQNSWQQIQPNSQRASQPTDWIYWAFCAAFYVWLWRAKCGLPCCEFQHHDNELTLPIVEWIKSIRTSFSSSSSCWLFSLSLSLSLLPFHIEFNAVIILDLFFVFVTHSSNGCGCVHSTHSTLTNLSRLIITAVSPNVVIDIVLWLKIEKLGLYKGIHTIIIAVTTINDVLSIFLFNVILGVIFSTGILLLFFCFSFSRSIHCCCCRVWLSFSLSLSLALFLSCSCFLSCLLVRLRAYAFVRCTVIDFLSQ